MKRTRTPDVKQLTEQHARYFNTACACAPVAQVLATSAAFPGLLETIGTDQRCLSAFANDGFGALPPALCAEFPDLSHWGGFTDLRRRVAAVLECDPGGLCFSTSYGDAVVKVLLSIGLDSRDGIVSTDREFPTACRALRTVAGITGAAVRYLDMSEFVCGGDVNALQDKVLASIHENTRVVFLSHILFDSGQKLPLRSVVQDVFRHRNDILFMVDGAHVLGHTEPEILACPNVVYLGSGHKWLGGQRATTIVHVGEGQHCQQIKRGLRNMITEAFLVPAHWAVVEALPVHSNGNLEGSVTMEPYLTLSAALCGKTARHFAADYDAIRGLAGEMFDCLQENGVRLLSPRDESNLTGITTVVNIASDQGLLMAQAAELASRGFFLTRKEQFLGFRVSLWPKNTSHSIRELVRMLGDFNSR